jgi:YD repeat-containing protein
MIKGLERGRNFAKIHENHCKCPQVPARPRNCRQRCASHCANWTYIATYDADGRKASQVDPLGRMTTLNRQTGVIDALGNFTATRHCPDSSILPRRERTYSSRSA